jgi:hypothetical protein
MCGGATTLTEDSSSQETNENRDQRPIQPILEVRRSDWRFLLLYSEIKQSHANVAALDDQKLRIITSQIRDRQRLENSLDAGIAIALSSFFYIWAVAFFALIRHPIERYAGKIAHYSPFHLPSLIPMLLITSAILAILYAPASPFLKQSRLPQRFEAHSPLGPNSSINYRSFRFIFVYFIQFWTAALVIMATLEIGFFHSMTLAKAIIIIYLFIPTTFILLILTVIVLGSLLKGVVERDKKVSGRENLALLLLEIIHRLDMLRSDSIVTSRSANTLAYKILRTADHFHDLVPDHRDKATRWASLQIGRASDNFLRLASWAYMPKPDTWATLTDEVIRYFNIVIEGNLQELPRKKVGLSDGLFPRELEPTLWKRLGAYTSWVVYFAIPIVFYLVVVIAFHLRVEETVRSCASVIYLIWAILGFLLLLERMPDERKGPIFDLIRFIIRRGE